VGFSADTLRDRVAIVTGASQGIGRAIAVELARVGAHVVACSRRPGALEPVAEAVRAEGRRALAVACDVADARQVDCAVAQTLDAFGRIDEEFRRTLDGLTAEQLTYLPNDQANSIAWLAWHLTRVQDDHVSDLAGRPQAWLSEGWHARFGKPANAGDTGFGDSASAVAALRPESAQLLLDYFGVVHARSQDYLRGLDAADLDRELDEQWDPPVTVGVRLVSVIADCLQHVGQMAYVRGLIEQRHWLKY